MRTVRIGLAAGLLAQLTLLVTLGGTVGLGPLGWSVGLVCGLATAGGLGRGLAVAGAHRVGAANQVTQLRAASAGSVAALVAESFRHPVPAAALVTLAVVALVLDAVDGQVARRTGGATAVGARFDLEVDAFLILVLSIPVARSVGSWVLLIGLARYAFVAAYLVLPWLRQPTPPRYWCKTVAAIQSITLTIAVAGILPRGLTALGLGLAAVLLGESFGRDIWWLWRRHAAATPPVGPAEPAGRRSVARRIGAGATTSLATGLVWLALVAPNRLTDLTVRSVLRIPLEGLVVVALAVWLAPRWRRLAAVVGGVGLGLLVVVKALDTGFYAELDRPFNPVTDRSYFDPAFGVLRDSVGSGWATAAVVGTVMAAVGVLVVMPWALLRITSAAARRRPQAARTIGALGTAWGLCALLGVNAVAGAPVASTAAAALAYDTIHDARAALHDQNAFAATLTAPDSFARQPADDLVPGLRGKDVLVVFIESYGRVAVQGSAFSPQVDDVLRHSTATLARAGFASRSAFLTSPTYGGISWLAHSTLQSGLWIDNQLRYDQLLASTRFTLSDAFRSAGWRTVSDDPSDPADWPQGRSFYHYDHLYNAANVGYAGPRFGYARIPDQYTLTAFRDRELAPGHQPVMAEIDLVSSHTPWAPLPHLVAPNRLGDGSVFDGLPEKGRPASVVWRHSKDVRAAYGQSIQYSLSALTAFVTSAHDPNLVLIVLGDHQPARVVSGTRSGHDVPISIIAHDPAVLTRVSSWNWQPGLLPDPQAAVWPMSAFRNRFLAAYGPQLVSVHR